MNTNKKSDGLPDIARNTKWPKPVVLILFVIALLIVVMMYFYSKSHQQKSKVLEETYTIQTNPEEINTEKKIEKPIATVNSQGVSQEVMQQEIELIQEKQKALQQRLAAPLMLVSGNQTQSSTITQQQTQAVSNDENMQFMSQVSSQKTETTIATHIGNLNNIIAQGSLIHGILETASNSDLPGALRAIVSEPTYSEDGSQQLIPVGSRLIGQYKSGMLQGQSRIFIVWTRLITPNGFSIQLGSLGVDSLGVAGIGADELNRHFWERFGTASLLSLLGAGTANMNNQDKGESADSYRAALASSFMQSASESVQQDSRIPPTLSIYQGKRIIVFVAKDLHFESITKEINSKLKIF